MHKYKSLLILILFVLASVAGDNRILQVFGNQSSSIAFFLSMSMLVLQTVSAPIQGGFSDFYCRKKSLTAALLFSFLSIIFLFFVTSKDTACVIFSVLIVFLNGALGNIVPLSWSALADSTKERNLRFFLAISMGAYAVGYMVLVVLDIHYVQSIEEKSRLNDLIPTILFVVSILVCIFFFNEVEEKKTSLVEKKLSLKQLLNSEFSSLKTDLASKGTRWVLLTYFLWAVSQYSILILITDFQTEYTSTVILMILGYLFGVVILGFCKKICDYTIIKMAFFISVFGFILFYIINFLNEEHVALATCYFFYTVGNAFLTSSILSLFSRERSTDQQGKGFGLIVSADSAGFLIATIIVILFNAANFKTEYLVLFSFISFIISIYTYSQYSSRKKLSPA